ncbi:MAG: ribonuclease HII [Candidatus Kapaibacteriota bacterium]|jgi:ribonuclease HII
MGNRELPNFILEQKYWEQGVLVAGVDEAGRGALAGPVFAAAVVYPINFVPMFEVFDSKTISGKRREKLYETIIKNCLAFSIARVDVDIINETNILRATFLAMNSALEKIANLKPFAFIDGNRFVGDYPHQTIVDGDAKSFSVASASILAKVERDRWMSTIAHSLYPNYGFDKHKGYGTKFHIQQILANKPSPLHRKIFLRKILRIG